MFRNSETVGKNAKMSLIFYRPEEMITEGTEELRDWAVTDSWDCFDV